MTMEPTRRPDQSNGEWLQISPGERFKVRTSTRDMGGAYTALEFVADARYGTPMHIHDHEDEHFIVLEGSVRIANGDKTLDARWSAKSTTAFLAIPTKGWSRNFERTI
jgi:mannose-6-phosphate isomerase-like protein (cupin superfamily)